MFEIDKVRPLKLLQIFPVHDQVMAITITAKWTRARQPIANMYLLLSIR